MSRNALPLVLLLSTTLMAEQVQALATTCGSDPYGNPSQDRCNVFRYIPNKVANIIFTAAFNLAALLLIGCFIHRRIRWFIIFFLGTAGYGTGMLFRVIVRDHIDSRQWQVVTELFVILSPCLFLAADYVLLGHIVTHLSAGRLARPLSPRWIARTFVISDIITFIIQAVGASLLTSKNESTLNLSKDLLLVGLIAQLVSFAIFTGLCLLWYFRAKCEGPELFSNPTWRPLFWALIFTCLCILVRCAYRVVEFAGGLKSYVYTHEVFFLLFDSLPLCLTAITYIIFWPGRYLTSDNALYQLSAGGVEDRHEMKRLRDGGRQM